ncbi:MAG: transposase [Acidobacteria bacterium]|nr:transposase [Acidobacteriota bacterium]
MATSLPSNTACGTTTTTYRGVVMYEDEASFWLDGTLHQTWARVGVQPRVDTCGMRKTAHIFGALTLEERPRFHDQCAPVFNAQTFWEFLRLLVRRARRKVFLIIDHSPCHNLDGDGTAWLAANRRRLELFRLPSYSPELQSDRGRLEEDQEADHAQRLLPHDRRTRCRADGDLRHLSGTTVADRRSGRPLCVMIPCPRDSV